jgi:DNA-binding response OmpR family regulator
VSVRSEFITSFPDYQIDAEICSRDMAVARHARAINRKSPVVYMSGASGSHWTSQGVSNSIMIGKPISASEIVAVINSLLRHAV